MPTLLVFPALRTVRYVLLVATTAIMATAIACPAVARAEPATAEFAYSRYDDEQHIYFLDANGTETQSASCQQLLQVTDSCGIGAATLMDDGRQVVATASTDSSQTYLLRFAPGSEQAEKITLPLSDGEELAYRPAVSRDHRYAYLAAITFHFPAGGISSQILRVNLATGERSTLVSDPHLISSIATSPGGDRLYYVVDTRGDFNSADFRLYSADLEGDDVYEIDTDGIFLAADGTGPQLSPDGRFIAYGAMEPDSLERIWVQNLSTGERTRLTQPSPDDAWEQFGTWSEDGSRIYFRTVVGSGEFDHWSSIRADGTDSRTEFADLDDVYTIAVPEDGSPTVTVDNAIDDAVAGQPGGSARVATTATSPADGIARVTLTDGDGEVLSTYAPPCTTECPLHLEHSFFIAASDFDLVGEGERALRVKAEESDGDVETIGTAVRYDGTAPSNPTAIDLTDYDAANRELYIGWESGEDPALADGSLGSGAGDGSVRVQRDGAWSSWRPAEGDGIDLSDVDPGDEIFLEYRSTDGAANESGSVLGRVTVSAAIDTPGDSDSGEESVFDDRGDEVGDDFNQSVRAQSTGAAADCRSLKSRSKTARWRVKVSGPLDRFVDRYGNVPATRVWAHYQARTGAAFLGVWYPLTVLADNARMRMMGTDPFGHAVKPLKQTDPTRPMTKYYAHLGPHFKPGTQLHVHARISYPERTIVTRIEEVVEPEPATIYHFMVRTVYDYYCSVPRRN